MANPLPDGPCTKDHLHCFHFTVRFREYDPETGYLPWRMDCCGRNYDGRCAQTLIAEMEPHEAAVEKSSDNST